MKDVKEKKIALLGLMLESNNFATVINKEDFLNRVYLVEKEIIEELRSEISRLPAEFKSFCSILDQKCEWIKVPILFGLVEAGGPIDHNFFIEILNEIEALLRAAGDIDGVYICNHGAMVTTADLDPDGMIFKMVREIVGPEVPIIATLDLHANISQEMVDNINAIIGYRTNPHIDMIERGEEAAITMFECLRGMKTEHYFIRLPIIPPTVTLLTSSGPYADLINFGQSLLTYEILNVSIFGGFAYSDTHKNGLSIIVTTRNNLSLAKVTAISIANFAWIDFKKYSPVITPLHRAIELSAKVSINKNMHPIILADVADNPGGGGNGNTTWILEELVNNGISDAVIGVFNDPLLAEDAYHCGVGATFRAVFNRNIKNDMFSRRYEAHARVLNVKEGDCVGRRGFYANRRMNLGLTALIDLGGIKVVVISIRTQCADPIFFEMMGIDLRRERIVVVKSRGHFRAGFDEFFEPEHIIEVDAPGLTSPILSRFNFKNITRPAFPIDTNVNWVPPNM